MVSGLGFDGFPPGARKTEQNMLSTAPRVHLNGSGKKNLMDGYSDAIVALNKAHHALCQTAPHMRDYYVQPDGDLRFRWAQDNHIARLKRIEDSIAEIEALGIAVSDQGASYNPQVKGVGEDRWTGSGLYFATPEEALAYAADLQGRWMGCKGGAENRRAEPSDDPPNYEWRIVDHKLVALKPGDAA